MPCSDRESMLRWFSYIKYDEKYMPELFLTLPELQNYKHVCFFNISCENVTNANFVITIVESSKSHFPLLRCQIGDFLHFSHFLHLLTFFNILYK